MAKTDDLQAWRSFIVFARSGTLTAAAKALEAEPSSISRAISGLERTLGVELIRHGVPALPPPRLFMMLVPEAARLQPHILHFTQI